MDSLPSFLEDWDSYMEQVAPLKKELDHLEDRFLVYESQLIIHHAWIDEYQKCEEFYPGPVETSLLELQQMIDKTLKVLEEIGLISFPSVPHPKAGKELLTSEYYRLERVQTNLGKCLDYLGSRYTSQLSTLRKLHERQELHLACIRELWVPLINVKKTRKVRQIISLRQQIVEKEALSTQQNQKICGLIGSETFQDDEKVTSKLKEWRDTIRDFRRSSERSIDPQEDPSDRWERWIQIFRRSIDSTDEVRKDFITGWERGIRDLETLQRKRRQTTQEIEALQKKVILREQQLTRAHDRVCLQRFYEEKELQEYFLVKGNFPQVPVDLLAEYV